MNRSPQVIRQESERIDSMAELLIGSGVALDSHEPRDRDIAASFLLQCGYRSFHIVSERRSFLDDAIAEARRRVRPMECV